jgi:hypothetical protein
MWLMVMLAAVSGCQGAVRPAAREPAIPACGASHPVPGYGNHRSYPLGVPVLPPVGSRIVRCFASVSAAAARGFPADVPAGTVLADGVYLVPTGAVTLGQCRSVARAVGFLVPCPGVSPTIVSSVVQTPTCQDSGGCQMWHAFGFEEVGFAVPPGYQGVDRADGHFLMVAARAAGVGSRALFCPRASPIRTVTIERTRGIVVACPESDAGTSEHVMLRWVHAGVLVGVTFHGVNATNIDLDLAVARHLIWVRP